MRQKKIKLIKLSFRKHGVNTPQPNPGERVRHVRFTDDTIAVDLLDGRTIVVPLVWYPRLLSATHAQRLNWQKCGAGFGIHWPDLDEDLSTEGILRGAASSDALRSKTA